MKAENWILSAALAIGFLGTALAAVDPPPAGQAVRITAINFKGSSDPNEIDIEANGPIAPDKQVNARDKQVVLTIPGAVLANGLGRSLDTSSFNSNVTLISPYQTDNGVRIVVQMKDSADADLVQNGDSASLTVPIRPGQILAPAGSSAAAGAPDAAQGAQNPGKDAPTGLVGGKGGVSADPVSDTVVQPSAKPDDALQAFLDNSASKKFSGKPISLQVRDVDVVDVFSMISEASGFNIVLGDDVKGKLTLSLTDVPWDQALDVVLQEMHLGADRHGNVLRVMTLQNLAAEKQLELKAKQATQAVEPKVTRIFPISYAKLDDLNKIVQTLAATDNAVQAQTVAPNAAQNMGGAGAVPMVNLQDVAVIADNRTNSLIVRAIPEFIDRVKKLIEILDTQTPQVLIEGKVVEATEDFSNSLSSQFGYSDLSSLSNFVSFNGGDPVDPLLSTNGNSQYTTVNGIAPITGVTNQIPTTGIGLSLTPFGKRINIFLQIAESESKAKILTSPKTVVENKQEAKVVESLPVMVPVIQPQLNGPPITTYQEIDANLSLDVTPTVTSDGSVLMNLTLTRDVIQPGVGQAPAAVAHRNITTNVLVESGTTLVMGGLYTTADNDSESGFPYLRNIPILGALFGSNSTSTQRSELFFFVTPQIINPKKSGISAT